MVWNANGPGCTQLNIIIINSDVEITRPKIWAKELLIIHLPLNNRKNKPKM